jgi:hypothetical protein
MREMDIEAEREVAAKVEMHIRNADCEMVCFEIGRFIEGVAGEIYFSTVGSHARNAKTAIDLLIDDRLIPRPLGYKLHVVRELRNVVAHKLPYSIAPADAVLCINALNQTIEWLHQGKLAKDWIEVVDRFEEGEKTLLYIPDELPHEYWGGTPRSWLVTAIPLLYDSLKAALDLKIEALGLEGERTSFFSSVELLAEHGIDVRSEAWVLLTNQRNVLAHHLSLPRNVMRRCRLLKAKLPELKRILRILNPFNERECVVDYPQVVISSDLIDAFASYGGTAAQP